MVDNLSAKLMFRCCSLLVVICKHHRYFKWHFGMTGSKNWETRNNNPFSVQNIQRVVRLCSHSNTKMMSVGLEQYPFFTAQFVMFI